MAQFNNEVITEDERLREKAMKECGMYLQSCLSVGELEDLKEDWKKPEDLRLFRCGSLLLTISQFPINQILNKKSRLTMQKELIEKANEIIGMIEKNERAVEELEKYAESGKALYTDVNMPGIFKIINEIDFEPWEIRLMTYNKKQRIKALKAQLERT